METRSVPPVWWADERMVITLADVLRVRAEEMRRRNGR